MTDLSNAALAQSLSDFIDKQNLYIDERIAIDYGSATYVTSQPAGQPGPGYYPLHGFDGQLKWVPCTERIRADALATTTMDLRDTAGNLANSYTLRVEHSNKILRVYNNGGTTLTVTLPANLGAGFNCILLWMGTHTTMNLAAGSGVTLLNAQGVFRPNARYSAVSLICPTNNNYLISGDLKA